MEGQEYVTINPGTLSDPDLWSYSDLQKIAKTVGLRANSSRDELVRSLDEWNRSRKDGTQTLVENVGEVSVVNLDMNVIGNNFAILAVKVQAASESTIASPQIAPNLSSPMRKRKLTSMVGFGDSEDDVCLVNSNYLRPLRSCNNTETTTPGRSCLKRISSYCETCDDDHISDPLIRDSQNIEPMLNISSAKSTDSVSSVDSTTTVESMTEDCCQSHSKVPRINSSPIRRVSNICFSPFNGVRVIAHRVEVEAAYREEDEFQRDADGDGDPDSYWSRSFW